MMSLISGVQVMKPIQRKTVEIPVSASVGYACGKKYEKYNGSCMRGSQISECNKVNQTTPPVAAYFMAQRGIN